jgi:mannose-6-phosphate isomerase-like protein (cupin superfamily)
MADTTPSTSPTDPLALSKSIQDRYRNVSLATVNDHEIRMSVMTERFGWHRHPDSDETFLCVDGELVIEFEDGEVAVAPGQLVTVPAGTLHRTRPGGARSVNLTFERKDAATLFEEPQAASVSD